MKVVGKLTLAALGLHMADQAALVAVPLAAALVFDASAATIGILVACQSMAYLVGSIPFGVAVDRADARWSAIAASLLSAVGLAAATASLLVASLTWFAVAVTVAGFGIVLFVLAALSIIPRVVGTSGLATANARVEVPRALASFAVPLLVGLAMTDATAPTIFAAGALCALGALIVAVRLPRFPALARQREPMVQRILEGGRLVLRHQLLLPISLCAVFWNLAFAALLVLMVPLIVDVFRVGPGTYGVAIAAFGLASIVGTLVIGRFSDRIPPNVVLLFGPGSTAVAACGLLFIPSFGPMWGGPEWLVYGVFFGLGFGPSMWLIAQNSVRQIVTPGEMLGRVNAVIQTAIYGIRPIGAMLAGVIADATSTKLALGLVVLTFAASFGAALFSQLRRVRRYSDLRAAETA